MPAKKIKYEIGDIIYAGSSGIPTSYRYIEIIDKGKIDTEHQSFTVGGKHPKISISSHGVRYADWIGRAYTLNEKTGEITPEMVVVYGNDSDISHMIIKHK